MVAELLCSRQSCPVCGACEAELVWATDQFADFAQNW